MSQPDDGMSTPPFCIVSPLKRKREEEEEEAAPIKRLRLDLHSAFVPAAARLDTPDACAASRAAYSPHFNQENVHRRDARIRFVQATHKYEIDGSSAGITSVTGVLHRFFPSFEEQRERIAQFCIGSRNYRHCTSVEDVLREWDRLRDDGTALHEAIDDWWQQRYKGVYRYGASRAHYGPPQGLFQFRQRYPQLVPYRTEWSIFDRDLCLAGQLDFLGYVPNASAPGGRDYWLVDWKNTTEISSSSRDKKTGTDSLTADMPDCKLSHYTLQLNIYAWILRHRYGIHVKRMLIANFNSRDARNYEEFAIPRWERIDELMARLPLPPSH